MDCAFPTGLLTSQRQWWTESTLKQGRRTPPFPPPVPAHDGRTELGCRSGPRDEEHDDRLNVGVTTLRSAPKREVQHARQSRPDDHGNSTGLGSDAGNGGPTGGSHRGRLVAASGVPSAAMNRTTASGVMSMLVMAALASSVFEQRPPPAVVAVFASTAADPAGAALDSSTPAVFFLSCAQQRDMMRAVFHTKSTVSPCHCTAYTHNDYANDSTLSLVRSRWLLAARHPYRPSPLPRPSFASRVEDRSCAQTQARSRSRQQISCAHSRLTGGAAATPRHLPSRPGPTRR